MRLGEPAGLSVARYLRAEEAVVPFRSRPELDELLSWCVSGDHAAARLVTGDGGAGKTRLALRLCEELALNGWQPLWVRRGSERDAVGAVHTLGQPCVLVVDYAETRDELAGFLDDVAADHDGPDLRVVLLARSAGEWWQQLLADAEERTAGMLEPAVPLPLGPVRAAGGMQEVFNDAVAAFAEEMGTERPAARLVLSDPDPVVLVVHAAALLAVIDYAIGAEPPDQAVSAQEVLEALLRHEARYWTRSAAGRGLDLDLSVLRLAVAVGCLIGADSESTASLLLSRVPDLDSAERRGRVARWLRDLYPAPPEGDSQERDWLGPLRPDRLAEQLITGELARRPELMPPLFTGLDEARAARALTVLARAALTQDRAVGLLSSVLAADLDHLAVPAVSVAVETNPVMGELLNQVFGDQPVSRETLMRVVAVSPYPSFALAAPLAAVLQRLADDSADDTERAGMLIRLSNRLGELGRREDALAASEQAVTIYHHLAEAGPDAVLPDYAMSLSNRAGRLGSLGRQEEALTAIEQATSIYRQLADARPAAFLPNLAMSLNNQAISLSELGRQQEAVAAIERATSIYRELAGARPDAFLPNLAMSLNNQSVRLVGLGRREEALAASEQATSIYRQLAEARPDAFLPNLAMCLNSQSNCLGALGRPEEALAAIEQATSIYRQLAGLRPDAFLSVLAMSLSNQSIRLGELGRRAEALAASEQATSIYGQLAGLRPAAFLPNLAMCLNNQSIQLGELGRRAEALAAIEEAVAIRRQLAEGLPDAFLPAYATSLGNQSIILSALGKRAEALAAGERAVTIYRQFADTHPDAFLPDFGPVLLGFAHVLSTLGRRTEASAIRREAATVAGPSAQSSSGSAEQ